MCAHHTQSIDLLLRRYRIVEVRDQGGFGNVLVAWDIRLQRRVAIKQIPLQEASSTFDEALAEARASSFLTHPNIVTVYDFLSDKDYAYIVMEYVDGYSLAELLQRLENNVLIYNEIVYVFSALADALTYAHENGVLHLDIKPANILIDRTGNVKLADFGMASLMSAAGFGGARGGTIGYMPSEQLLGEEVDERTDIFALACVMYEALLGKTPFKTNTIKQSLKALKKGAPYAQEIENELPFQTAESLAQALAYKQEKRFWSVSEFAESALPLLGDIKEGKCSIVDFITTEEDDFEPAEWISLDNFSTRYPRIMRVLTRISAALPVASIAIGSVTTAAFAGFVPFWLIPVFSFCLIALSLLTPTLSILTSLWALSACIIMLHQTPLGILGGSAIAICAVIWAITCGSYRSFAAANAFAPAITWLPFWTPSRVSLVWNDPLKAGFSAALGTGTAWSLWALITPIDPFVVLLTLLATAVGGAFATYYSETHPVLAQIVPAVLMFFALFLTWRELNGVFAGTNCIFLVGSLILMFALNKQLRHHMVNTGD